MRSVLILLAIGSLLPLLNPVETILACAIVPHDGNSVSITEESALIVYDSDSKTEHFLRSAHFDTASADFGFIVPTPSKPELAEASTDIFPKLSAITKPVIVTRTVYEQGHIVCLAPQSNAVFSQVGSRIMPGGGGSVQVVERKQVGGYEAAVLKATDAAALQDWLKVNDYRTRPALDAWFGVYIERGWYFTAFKIGSGSTPASVNPTVRISFKTDTPVYPYREPSDAASSKAPRLLRLFVLSDARVEGKIGNGATAQSFAGNTVWSQPLGPKPIAAALGSGKIPVEARDWHLTEFEDRSSPRNGSDDLFFSTSAVQDRVERPRIEHVVTKTTYWTEGLIYGSMIVLAMVALRLRYRRLRRPDSEFDHIQ